VSLLFLSSLEGINHKLAILKIITMKKILLFILISLSFSSFASNKQEDNHFNKLGYTNYRYRGFRVPNIDRLSFIGVTYSNLGIYKLPSFGVEYVSKPFGPLKHSKMRALVGIIYSFDCGYAKRKYNSAAFIYVGGVFYTFFKFGIITSRFHTVNGDNSIRAGGLFGVQIPVWDNRVCFGCFTNSIERNITATIAIAIK
jgi:hypothetical protein